MIALSNSSLMSPQEYLDWEERQPIKYEYVNGEAFAMAGGTLAHNEIAINLTTALKSHLRGQGCKVYMTDAKLGISQQGLFYYPDVMVTCNPRDRQEKKVVYHPCFIAEVLSSSTEGKDRGIKFRNYRRIDTFREYALISAETMMVEIYRLNEQGKWELTTYSPEENNTSPEEIDIHLTTVDLHFSLALLYEDVILPEAEETSDRE
ncbi:MAG: Uma2 family endonuclease [Spirulina sp.]